MTAVTGVETARKDWMEGWAGAPRLGLDPKPPKKEYGNEWDQVAHPTGVGQGVARWQRKLAQDYTFIVHVRLALEYLQHFRQIPEWEEAVSISMGHGCYRKRPSNAVFGG